MSCRTIPLWALSLVVAIVASVPGATFAYSLLPLATEEAQTLPSNVIEATLGMNYFRNLRYPAFTPPSVISSETLMSLPVVVFRVGVGGWAEFQASYEMLYLNETAVNDATNKQYGGGDARIFTKLWFMRERDLWPALGMRLGAKLPNATRTSGLGTDDMDFAAAGLASKTLGPVTVHVNLGILLLGNSGPIFGNSFGAGGQDDLVTYSIGVASKPLGATVEGTTTFRLLGELNGQTASRFDNDLSDIRVGLQMQRGRGTLYVGVSTGLVSGSEEIGANAGFTYAFDPITLFASD
jgi:hypothetical protein